MKILVADDAPESRRFLEMLLGRWGHEVVEANDGVAALESLLADQVPLAFLDWMMPGLDGPSVCRRLRAEVEGGGPYVILLTGRTAPEDIIHGIEAGADDYMVKPLDAQELRVRLAVAERAIEARRALAGSADEEAGRCPVCGRSGPA